MEPDLWVEFVPYTETRRYVKRVLEYRIVYQHRLGVRPVRLSDLLRPLPPAPANRAELPEPVPRPGAHDPRPPAPARRTWISRGSGSAPGGAIAEYGGR